MYGAREEQRERDGGLTREAEWRSDAEQRTGGREIRRRRNGGLERDRGVWSEEETPNTSPNEGGGG